MPYSEAYLADPHYEEPLAQPSATWTDLYELTMAQALWRDGRHEQKSTFHAFIRETPYDAAYLVSSGQNIISEWYDKHWKFTDRDIARLRAKTVKDTNGHDVPLFEEEFLQFLKDAKPQLTIDMMPEGELAFPGEPIYRVSGPVWQCLAVESAILNTMNSQSNFATYASMLKTAANGKPVCEFALRRSQAVGGLSSTRGAYVGGAELSSNVWAETNYNIPTIGTMAHAYVMMHETELEAYINWAKHNPNLGVFLPDTYDAKNGMLKVIEACKKTGATLKGFRQDSGDLGYLAAWGREQAAKAGFNLTVNNASNDLNATKIAAIELQDGTALDVFSVGTQLGTCAEQPALGGVYKIANIYENGLTNEEILAMKQAVREGHTDPKDIRGRVRDIMKLSGDAIKMTYPGELDLVRYLEERDGQLYFAGGTICSEWSAEPLVGADPSDPFSGKLARDIMSVVRGNHSLGRTFNKGARAYRPIQRMFTDGKLTGTIENVHEARARAERHKAMLDPSHKRLVKPHEHVVGVEESLADRQFAMARRLRQTGNTVEANLV